jgi:hypothetical protein
MNVTIFKTVVNEVDINTPHYISLEDVLKHIKNGKWADKVAYVRSALNKIDFDNRKKQLPAIIFSGKFSARRTDGFLESINIIPIDFDKMKTEEERESVYSMLKANQYVYCVYTSVSGKGYRALVRAEFTNSEEYLESFLAIDEMFKESKYFDLGCSDIGRANFISHDPDVYINNDAQLFIGKVKDTKEYLRKRRLKTPENTFKALIKWMDTSMHTYSEGQRNHYIYILASAMCRYGVFEDDTKRLFYAKFSDLDINEIDTTIESAYKKNQFGVVCITSSSPQENTAYYKALDQNENVFDPEKALDDHSLSDSGVYAIVKGIKTAKSFGLKAMDKYLLFKEKEYYAVVSSSKMGKTQTMAYLMMMAAKNAGQKLMIVTTETSIAEYKYNMVQFYNNRPAKDIYGQQNISDTDIAEALQFINQYFIFTISEIDHLQILDIYHYMATKHVYVDAIVIDPLSNIKKSPKIKAKSGNDYYEELNVEYLNFAKKYCSVIAIAHTISSKEREHTAPYVQDAEYGSQLARRCHVGISIFREIYDELRKNIVQMHIRFMRTKIATGGDTTTDSAPIELEFVMSANEFGYNITVDGVKWLSPLLKNNVRADTFVPTVDMSRFEKENDKPF